MDNCLNKREKAQHNSNLYKTRNDNEERDKEYL